MTQQTLTEINFQRASRVITVSISDRCAVAIPEASWE